MASARRRSITLRRRDPTLAPQSGRTHDVTTVAQRRASSRRSAVRGGGASIALSADNGPTCSPEKVASSDQALQSIDVMPNNLPARSVIHQFFLPRFCSFW